VLLTGYMMGRKSDECQIFMQICIYICMCENIYIYIYIYTYIHIYMTHVYININLMTVRFCVSDAGASIARSATTHCVFWGGGVDLHVFCVDCQLNHIFVVRARFESLKFDYPLISRHPLSMYPLHQLVTNTDFGLTCPPQRNQGRGAQAATDV